MNQTVKIEIMAKMSQKKRRIKRVYLVFRALKVSTQTKKGTPTAASVTEKMEKVLMLKTHMPISWHKWTRSLLDAAVATTAAATCHLTYTPEAKISIWMMQTKCERDRLLRNRR